MVTRKKLSTLLVLAFASLLLVLAPMAGAAINTGFPSYDKLMQTELDSLMDQVAGQFENTGGYLEKSAFYSVLTKGLANQGSVKTAYDIAIKAQNKSDADKNNPELKDLSRVAMDDLFLSILYQVQLNKALAATDQEITTKLIDILEGRGEGFSERPGFILDPLASRGEEGRLPEEDDPTDPTDDPKGDFLYYGKAYDLAQLALRNSGDPENSNDGVSKNGVLWFGDITENPNEDNTLPPATIPMFLSSRSNSASFNPPILANPSIRKNDDFYRFTWSNFVEGPEISPVSTTLYKKSNIISFVYDEQWINDSFYIAAAGLWPGGSDSLDSPGQGINRNNIKSLDLISQVGNNFNNPDNDYLTLIQEFDTDSPFDLFERFVVWIPDASSGFTIQDEGIGNQYSIHTGNPFMVVDRSHHDYDDERSSLDQGITHISNNPDTLNDDFRYGFQVDYTGNTKTKLAASNFLAYVVQVEEDIVNEKILEMHDPAIGIIDGLRSYTSIRNRDAWFDENADAQAGRVMKDIHGNWVRVQQYILKPDNATVRVLNVSLREAGSNLSGMSTIDFTTNFRGAITGSIKDLPWGGYLTTTIYETTGHKSISYDGSLGVNSMSVKFTNPGNEYLSEVRTFDDGTGTQFVTSEMLTLHSTSNHLERINTFGPLSDEPSYQYIAHFSGSSVGGGYYNSDDAFLNRGDTKIIGVGIYKVEDTPDASIIGTGAAGESEEYRNIAFGKSLDIWAVLGADYNAGPKEWSINDGQSIEIVMDQEGSFFKNPIDTIFIPMSHMSWGDV